jgi:hypothetical protein
MAIRDCHPMIWKKVMMGVTVKPRSCHSTVVRRNWYYKGSLSGSYFIAGGIADMSHGHNFLSLVAALFTYCTLMTFVL